jgi:hypothetical protein
MASFFLMSFQRDCFEVPVILILLDSPLDKECSIAGMEWDSSSSSPFEAGRSVAKKITKSTINGYPELVKFVYLDLRLI